MPIRSPASSWSPAPAAAARSGSRSIRHFARIVAGQVAFQAGVAAVGFLLFAVSFRLGLVRQIDILFYRGMVLLGIAFLATLVLAALAARRLPRLEPSPSAIFAAASLSLALNLSAFVLGPVTVDRSVSVFLLASMSRDPDRTITPDEMSRLFGEVYVGELRQIERRFGEQIASGNIARAEGGYRITPQGLAFVALSERIAWLFETDPRLVRGGGRPAGSPDTPSRP